MSLRRRRRVLLKQFEQRLEESYAQLQNLTERVEGAVSGKRSAARVAATAAWITGAVAVVAAGLYAGKELRSRYKFKRRTPYDYYSHSSDPAELEFGVGT